MTEQVANKCECNTQGQLKPGYADLYDPELELPYVNHEPGNCQCTNELAQYQASDGTVRWLCSCCHTFTDRIL